MPLELPPFFFCSVFSLPELYGASLCPYDGHHIIFIDIDHHFIFDSFELAAKETTPEGFDVVVSMVDGECA